MDPVRILLVEDFVPDIKLTQRAFRNARITNEMVVARDGVEATEYLKSAALLPDLILLDLNMPRKDGWEVLAEMRASKVWCQIPTSVMTTSDAGPDVDRAYALGANAYITKPFGFAGFVAAALRIEDFWFRLVKLPTTASPRAL